MRGLNRKLIRDLWRMRGQALAIALVTAAGTTAFITLLGTLLSLEKTQSAYYERFKFADIFANVRRAPESVANELVRIPGVKQVTTRIVFNVVVDVGGMREPINSLLISAPREGEATLNNIYIRKGRLVRPGSADEVVMIEPFAEANGLHLGSHFSATIKGHRKELKLVGTALSPEYIFFGVPGAMVPDDRRFGVMWMDRDALAAAFDLREAANDVSLSVLPTVSIDDVINKVDWLLQRFGGVGAYARKDHVSHATLNGDIEQLRTTTEIAAPLFLGVVAFLLHMLMMRHVETEREHIGVLKAFGYRNRTIAWHYMKLVLVIVGVGICAGLAGGAQLGRAVTRLFAANYHFPFLEYSLTPTVFAAAIVIQLAAAVIGAFGSLHSAVRLPPAVAMRAPPPPVYRRTILEMLGLRLINDQPTRMILRHVIRWPARSLMTSLGIALATAILIAPMAVFDSAKHMVQVHFFMAERQDLTVAFAQVRPRYASIVAIEHEPGVLRVEPFRATLANISFGKRRRRITVIGKEAVNQLSRPVLKDLEALAIPSSGIVVSSSMASWLGAGVGDFLDVQFLEGRRPLVHLPIVAVAESYVGLTFFVLHMNIHQLNRIMADGDVLTGVNLRLDPTQAYNLFDALKNVPSVTGVVSHTAQLQAMRRMMQQTTRMTLLNVVFAAIIAFGIVYNNARISLAERSRELATMRMLGFSRLQVSYILFGELALLTFAAVPLGAAIGYWLGWKLTAGASNEMFRLPLWVEWNSFGYTIVTVLATVILSSLVVVRRVFGLDLISILKTRD
ncbi:ABC transporter permease [Bradyrhizobium sp. ORS 111]|uniref:ABC transporter permease n=1 Tax=Bradyrhizobium sp. ORS 111 TaxID=1685958 RepID=UPI00388DF352